jgi:hypothetical protein
MAIHSLSLTGKIIFYILLIIFAGSAISLLWRINNFFMVDVPLPRRHVCRRCSKPAALYQSSPWQSPMATKILTALVYAGLMRQTPQGTLNSRSWLENYSSFSRWQSLHFYPETKPYLLLTAGHSTADDVVYTIQQIQNPSIKSPKARQLGWCIVQKIDDRTVTFYLKSTLFSVY